MNGPCHPCPTTIFRSKWQLLSDSAPAMSTARVFFDVSADGSPMGRVVMEVSVLVCLSWVC